MKRLLLTCSSLAIFIICTSSGCQHDPIVAPSNSNPAIISSGDWLVSLFNDGGSDMTPQLAGYHFDFKTGGVLALTTNGQTTNGTWSVETDDSKQKFIIAIPGANSTLEELNEDWLITNSSANELDLKHDSGHQREIHFTKQ